MKSTHGMILTTPSDRELVMTRVFDAPRALVFDAMTKPDLLKRWFGPHGSSIVVCRIDLRVGGEWRYVVRSADGKEMGIHGVYREIVPPERLVYSDIFDDFPGEAIGTTVLINEGGKTKMIATTVYPSREFRDALLKGGIEHGAAESYDRLDQVLALAVTQKIVGEILNP